MKIVLYTEGLPFTGDTVDRQSLGGSESAFTYLARELVNLGHDVHAFCVCPTEGKFKGVQYYNLSNWEAWRDTKNCDIFVCSRFFRVFYQNIKAEVKILWCHDLYMVDASPELNELLPKIDLVYCLSDYHIQETIKILPNHHHKIRKNSNGVVLEEISEATKNISEKKHRVMFNSRPERGFSEAWEAFKIINDKTLEFLICSYQYPEESIGSDYLNEIESYVSSGFNVKFETFPKNELYRKIAESKLVIYPPTFLEIFCISALEAQACGTAYLTRPLGALSETVGYNYMAGDGTEEFAFEMGRILSDDKLRMSMERKGKEHAGKYSWKSVAKKFLSDAENLTSTSSYKNNQLLEASLDFIDQRPAKLKVDEVPMISCLTVAANRIVLLKQSVDCYLDQTYPNRELIVVASGEEVYKKAISDYLQILERDDIQLHWYEEKDNNLGKKRNYSIDQSKGDILCIWDDDDLYHPRRLELQYLHMVKNNAKACFLTDHFQFFEDRRELFWIDWTYGGLLNEHEQMLPGSMMITKDKRFRYPEAGPSALKGEDNAYMETFYQKIKVARLVDHGYLYVYRFHQRNVHTKMHHERVTAFGGREQRYLIERQRQLQESLEYYELPMPFTVRERNGKVHAVYNRS